MLSTEQLSHRYTLAEYLNCNNIDRDRNYELENGQIQEMPPESWQNLQVIMYLISEIVKVIPYQQLTNKAEIIISGSRVTARVPDLIVLTPQGARELAQYQRSTIILDMPPPILSTQAKLFMYFWIKFEIIIFGGFLKVCPLRKKLDF